ncbi:fibronectin, type III [Pseudomonas aeruginosa 39016]|nr:fibronectin, type III [Pseudomonas aeruginosa 39016]
MGVGRVCEQAQGSCVLFAAARGDRLLDLGVGGVRRATGRESPLQADLPRSAGGTQECQRRRRAGLTAELGQDRTLPDRRDVEGRHRTHSRQISTCVDAGHIDAGGAGTRQADPVAAVLLPFHVVGDGALHCRPDDRHGAHRQPLVDCPARRERDAGRWLHGGDRDDADRALLQPCAGIDVVELARLVLQAVDGPLAVVVTLGAHHPIELDSQVIGVERPAQFRLRRLRVGRGDGDGLAVDRLHRPALGAPARQVDDQAITGLGLSDAIERYHAASNSRDPAANLAAGQQRVSHRDDVARQRNPAFHTGGEGDGAVLHAGQHRPLSAPLRLALSRTADGRQLNRVVAIATQQRRVGIARHVGVVVVRRVVVADQGAAISGASRGGAVGHLPVNHIRPGEHVVEVGSARHVGLRHKLALRPIAHPPIDRRDIPQQCPCLGARLQVQITQKARLLAALPVWHQLVAILGDLVELPLVHHPGLDPLAQAEARVGADVVGDPRGIVGPGALETAIPDAGVRAQLRVVGGRHLDLAGLALDGDGRNVAELLCAELDVEQSCVWVAQLRVDHLSQTGDQHGVGDQAAVLVRRDPAHAYLPASGRRRQVDALAPLIAAGGLAVDSIQQHLLVGAAVGADVYGILDPVAVHVPTALLLLQGRPGEAQAHGGQLGVGHRTHPRGVAAQLHVHRGLVLHRGDAGDVVLIDTAAAPFPLHVGEVDVAAGVHQRGVVQVDIPVSGRFSKLALPHRQQQLGGGHGLQAVAGDRRLLGLAAAALAAGEVLLNVGAHTFLQA